MEPRVAPRRLGLAPGRRAALATLLDRFEEAGREAEEQEAGGDTAGGRAGGAAAREPAGLGCRPAATATAAIAGQGARQAWAGGAAALPPQPSPGPQQSWLPAPGWHAAAGAPAVGVSGQAGGRAPVWGPGDGPTPASWPPAAGAGAAGARRRPREPSSGGGGAAAPAPGAPPPVRDTGEGAGGGLRLRVVACLIENRAREVGLAVLDPACLTLRLGQFIEPGRSYGVTRMLLGLVGAGEVLLVAAREQRGAAGAAAAGLLGAPQVGAQDAGLNRAVMAGAAGSGRGAEEDEAGEGGGEGGGGGGYTVRALPRSCFDDTQGAQLLAAFASDDTAGVVAAAAGSRGAQYLALGAAGALLWHVLGAAGVSAALGVPVPRAFCAPAGGSRGRGRVAAAVAPLGWGPEGEDGGGGGGSGGFLRRGSLAVAALDAGLHMRLGPGLAEALEARRYDTVGELLADEALAADLGCALAGLPRDTDRLLASLGAAAAQAEQAGPGEAAGRDGAGRAAAAGADPGRGLGALVGCLLSLRALLGALPPLAETLESASSPLLAAVRGACEDPGLTGLREEIDQLLDLEATTAGGAFGGGGGRGGAFVSRVQQCFAVRQEAAEAADGLLGLARASLCRLTEAVYDLGARLAEEQGLPGLRMAYTARRGFYLTLPASADRGGIDLDAAPGPAASAHTAAPPTPASSASSVTRGGGAGPARGTGAGGGPSRGPPRALPACLMLLERRGRGPLALTCHELNALNARLRDATGDCLLLTRGLLEGVVQKAAGPHLPALRRLLDALALADLAAGLAEAARGEALGGPCVRPLLRPGGPLAIVQGRHPLLASAAAQAGDGGGGGGVTANDTFLSPCAPLHVVTGPNMSGKSSYLQQAGSGVRVVALLVVMAQAGCWVPAEFMSLSPCDALLGRMAGGGGAGAGGGGPAGSGGAAWAPEDDLEAGSSSFLGEMQDAAHVLVSASPSSLVLLDELGRATSTQDGVGLAWAVCEALLARGAPTLLATHLPQLGQLAALYPGARLWRLQVDASAGALGFTWRLQAASALAPPPHYGLALARAAGLPEPLVRLAARVADALEEEEQRRMQLGAEVGGAWAAAANVASRLMAVIWQWQEEDTEEADPCQAEEQALELLRALAVEAQALPLGELREELLGGDASERMWEE
ncbi:hypothetical protein HYH03_015753 [Edaphochlamys debaryana]|uniref:DNA mismatch repair proteins mutS family domain-containing protein n=1 Tax=Edaphochlamys debaryana TaxID=47281 RepID=A0A835XJX5_9CHLO|nr:hypothetical protein HYH03_015753 [Edaphochlamys debaryana]|eukprot:KAG2485478.1 hypothetical protein HYH03_015753 [Edaphochlamys debaryana]